MATALERLFSFGVVALVAATTSACAARPGPAGDAAAGLALVRAEARPDRLEAAGVEAAAMGDLTRAEQYFVAALRGGGDERRLVRRLVAVCTADERYPAALAYAEEHLARHPRDTGIRFVLASLASALGDVDSARAGFERVVTERPDIADAHYALASLLARDDGGAPRAREHYAIYLRLAPRGAFAEAARTELAREAP